jgi:uncharacterized protein YqeY
MTLQEQIKKDLAAAMKAKEDVKKDTLRVVIGEFNRMGSKVLSDDDVVKILKKLIKSERELIEIKGESEDTPYIGIIEGYLPKLAAEEEITSWIQDNVDFSKFKNRMQAMGMIMKHFGTSAEGDTVKKILQRMG